MAPSVMLSLMLSLIVVGCLILYTDGAPLSQRDGLAMLEISGGYNQKIKVRKWEFNLKRV